MISCSNANIIRSYWPYIYHSINISDYLEMAKSQILVIYGEDHPLYSITLTALLDELSMYERLKGLKPSNSKSSCPTKKYHKQELTYDTDRFEDVTNLELYNADNQSKLIAG